MRSLVISDIHGMYDKFMALLELVKYNTKEDRLILLGDYVDRGPEPIKALRKVLDLKDNGAVVLMGNHEKMLLDACAGLSESDCRPLNLHLYNGGSITWMKLNELSKEESSRVIKAIENLPSIAESDNYIFVHAGIDASCQSDDQDADTLLWAREEFINSPAYIDKIVIFGHTPTKYMGAPFTIWNGGDKIGIDCGAVYGGKLACLELPSMKEFYV